MAAAGAGFFVSAIIGQFDPPLAQTAAIVLQELWAPFFVALLLTLLTGGRLESRVDWLLVGAFVLALWIMQVVWLLFYEQDGNLLAAFPNADIADAVDKGQRSLAGLASRRGRGRGRPAMEGGVTPAPARAAAERRRQRRAAALRRAADQRPRDRLALADGPVAGDLLARERAGGLPRRPAALAPGPRRPGRPLPRPQDARAGRAAGGAGQDARRPEPRGRLPTARVAGLCRRRRAARCWFPRSPPIARPRSSRATAPSSPRSSTTPRSTTIPSSSRRSAPPRAWRSRTSACTPRRSPARRGAGLARAHRRGQRR